MGRRYLHLHCITRNLQKDAIICYTDRAMRIVTVTNERQITLLQGELEAVGVVPGDEFIVAVENGVIVLTPKCCLT